MRVQFSSTNAFSQNYASSTATLAENFPTIHINTRVLAEKTSKGAEKPKGTWEKIKDALSGKNLDMEGRNPDTYEPYGWGPN